MKLLQLLFSFKIVEIGLSNFSIFEELVVTLVESLIGWILELQEKFSFIISRYFKVTHKVPCNVVACLVRFEIVQIYPATVE